MISTLFPNLPEDTQIWIFALEGRRENQQEMLVRVRIFLDSWISHGRRVEGAATLLYDRFLVVSGRVQRGSVSGCSMDALTQAVTEAAHHTECQLISPMKIGYRNADGAVKYTSRQNFRQLLRTGHVTPDTPVYDLAVTTLGAMRAGAFEKPIVDSSFARVFRV